MTMPALRSRLRVLLLAATLAASGCGAEDAVQNEAERGREQIEEKARKAGEKGREAAEDAKKDAEDAAKDAGGY